jgi:hypothetical protein
MDVEDDAIGLVRAHRWMGVTAQARRLKEAGCKRVFDLDKEARADMERIAGRRVVRLVYAFLLANPDKTRGMLADLAGALQRIKERGGTVVDLDSRLDSETNPAAFKAVVADQVRRHNQGDKSADNHPKGTPGKPESVYSPGGWRKAHWIWKGKGAAQFPSWDAADAELRKIKATNTGEPFTADRAYKKWKGRGKRQ